MLYPLNKYLVVEPVEEPNENDKVTVLVPDGVQIESSRYRLVKLIEPNVESKLRAGMNLVVSSHSIEEITVLGCQHYLLPETHVIAFHGGEEGE